MLGSIIGDIVGSIYEFHNIMTKDFPLFSDRGGFTDDSILTLLPSGFWTEVVYVIVVVTTSAMHLPILIPKEGMEADSLSGYKKLGMVISLPTIAVETVVQCGLVLSGGHTTQKTKFLMRQNTQLNVHTIIPKASKVLRLRLYAY